MNWRYIIAPRGEISQKIETGIITRYDSANGIELGNDHNKKRELDKRIVWTFILHLPLFSLSLLLISDLSIYFHFVQSEPLLWYQSRVHYHTRQQNFRARSRWDNHLRIPESHFLVDLCLISTPLTPYGIQLQYTLSYALYYLASSFGNSTLFVLPWILSLESCYGYFPSPYYILSVSYTNTNSIISYSAIKSSSHNRFSPSSTSDFN